MYSPVIDLHSKGVLQQPDEVWEAVHAGSIAENETLQPQQGLQSQRQHGFGCYQTKYWLEALRSDHAGALRYLEPSGLDMGFTACSSLQQQWQSTHCGHRLLAEIPSQAASHHISRFST